MESEIFRVCTTARSFSRRRRLCIGSRSSGSCEACNAYAMRFREGCHLMSCTGADVGSIEKRVPVWVPTIGKFRSPAEEDRPPVPQASRLPVWLKPMVAMPCVALPNVRTQVKCRGSHNANKQSRPPLATYFPVGSTATESAWYWCAWTLTAPSLDNDGAGRTESVPGEPPVASQMLSPSGPQTIWFTSSCELCIGPKRSWAATRRSKRKTWSERVHRAMCFDEGAQQRKRKSFSDGELFFRSTS
mmetsp:Transcript_18990/g.53402  ORF Transcript_18990/g.53402 Transcript_18990/m.53402 type:complete len:245 (-) Transcript_18990:450-1184(-)